MTDTETDALERAIAIATLVAALGDNRSDATKQAATCALCRLAHFADAGTAIVQSGAILPLVAIMCTGGNDELKETAAIALWSLALRFNHSTAIAQAGAIAPLVAMLSNNGSTDTLRNAATELLHTLAMNGNMLEIVQEGAAVPLVAMCATDALQEMATELLETLACGGHLHAIEQARTRLHWATVRAFVHVRPYAIFWHAHVGKRLCAPGGKWAEHDRAAFEEEFLAPLVATFCNSQRNTSFSAQPKVGWECLRL